MVVFLVAVEEVERHREVRLVQLHVEQWVGLELERFVRDHVEGLDHLVIAAVVLILQNVPEICHVVIQLNVGPVVFSNREREPVFDPQLLPFRVVSDVRHLLQDKAFFHE